MFQTVDQAQKDARDAVVRGGCGMVGEHLSMGGGTAHRLEVVVKEIGET